ncbi:hypothetical protein [Epilithonimonas xixisoli]|uniref:Uncharacterized protein n=1 Tax=Epilithonimonas xixisoli TaxID=1476462 RepID=A0A4R8IHK6_9FLAO|nr:hypothetical protein [Epilithonimonas xixisoli]TDX86335.1 hypothetical protein B0I22_0451 [Epilithonimonas xixisoli]
MKSDRVDEIVKIFDSYLIDNNKHSITLKTANEILRKTLTDVDEKIDLKELLESGTITNAYQTQTFPKQWIIIHSNSFTNQNTSNTINSKQKIHQKSTNNNFNTYSELSVFCKRYEIAIVITVASLITIFIVYWLSREQNNDTLLNKKEYVESNNDSLNIESMSKVYSYISYENDKEINGTIIQTNKETTYHTFDFQNKIVTCKTKTNGKMMTFKYPINGFYKQEGLVATTYVIEVNTLGVKEIWFSPDVPNLGYDYDDGSRIACYNFELLNEE